MGQTLTANTTGIQDENGLTRVEYSYQWIANDGTEDSDIADATDASYTLEPGDAGKTIKVRVNFLDDAYYRESLTSAATGTVAATVPTQPLTLTVTTGGQSQELDASWQAPSSNGGSAITGYKVQWKEAAGSWDTEADVSGETVSGTTYTITGLTGGVEYAVRVIATNGVGDGPASAEATETPAAGTSQQNTEPENTGPTGLPTISGTAQVGQTLTAGTTGIDDADGLTSVSYSYQWVRNDAGTDADIAEATASAYTLVSADQGKTIKVRVSFTDDRGNGETLTSGAAGPVEEAPQEPLTASVQDVPGSHDGQNVFTFELRFSDEPKPNFSFRTLRDHALTATGGEITRAKRLDKTSNTGWTIHVQPDGNGSVTIVLTVTTDCDAEHAICTGDGRPLSNSLEITVSGPQNAGQNSPATGLPTISGTAEVGETLTADASGIDDADGLTSVSYSYQWVRNDGGTDTDIAEATASTYTLVSADQGKTIKVRVSFADDANNQESLTSEATAVVVARPNTPATGAPTVSGTAQAGQTLTAYTSGITDEDGLTSVSYSYQWIGSDGTTDTDIQGAAAATYTVSDDDVGKTIKVRVSFTDDWDNEETLTSAATDTVIVSPNSPATGLPTISGTAQAGETLTADTSGIDDADGLTSPTYSYQWVSNDGNADSDIQDATASTYEVSDGDVGKTIKLRVTFTDDGNNQESLTSEATAAVTVRPNSAATGLPTISGTAQAGETLTADTSGITDDDGLTNVSYSYQWLADAADIQDATASTYTLSDDEVGKTIKVRVTFTDDRGNGESLTSAATAAVAARPDSQETDAPPSDTGTAVEITVGDTVAGDIEEASEVDWFKVSLLASETYRIDMRGAWGGAWAEVDGEIVWVSPGTLEDPKLLGVFGEDDALVPGTDEEESGNDRGDSSEGKNSRITSFSPPADGYYYIAAAAEGAWKGTYELTITEVSDE